MILVLSGEGPTDLGACNNAQGRCSDKDFTVGPLALLIKQMLEARTGDELNFSGRCLYVGETALSKKAKELPYRLLPARSKKKQAEMGYFYTNALALGVLASEVAAEAQDDVVAVLFRDCDGTRSAKAELWDVKCRSIEDGFRYSKFSYGVPMLPRPTSEAWLIAAAQPQPYQNCQRLEELPGNEASPNHPKKKLDAIFGHHKSAHGLCDWLEAQPFDADRASAMPGFRAFRERLNEVLDQVAVV